MTKDPVFLIGLGLLVAAIVGGGVKLAGNEFPVLRTHARQVMAGLAGVGVMYFAYDQQQFRSEEITLRALGGYQGLCPGQHRVEGRIRAKGGNGEIRYRIFGHGYISGEGRQPFERGGATAYEAVVPVWATGRYTMTARVTSPNDLDSVPAVYDAICTNDPRSVQQRPPSAPSASDTGPSPVQQTP